MLHNFAVRITSFFVEKGLIESSLSSWCVYAIERKLTTYLSVTLFFVISSFISGPISAFLFLSFFMGLRKRTGGFHANTFLKCFLTSLGMILITFLALQPLIIFYGHVAIWTMLMATTITVVLFAPVNHPNMAMTSEELNANKKRAYLVMLFEIIVVLGLLLFGADIQYPLYGAMGAFAAAVTIIAAKIIKQEEVTNG